MAHFAQLNDDNIVTQVIVIGNDFIGGGDFPESETVGQTFIASIGLSGSWKQTSYSSAFRKNYAGIGYKYDPERDAFIAPRPFASWSLNDESCRWEAPQPYPTDSKFYVWSEEQLAWVAL